MAGSATVFQLKVTLRGSKPPIWRRLLVPEDYTLGDLHAVLQRSFGWEDSHLHHFEVGRRLFGTPDPGDFGAPLADEHRTILRDVVRVKSKLHYEYDFGDSWRHEIVVEKVVPAVGEEHYPKCTAGKRAGPPEDSGGVWGYEEKLAILADPEHEEHEEILDWMPEGFSPEAFDRDALNRGLAELGAALEAPAPIAPARKIGRNEPCPCGSGKKYKKCCALAPAPLRVVGSSAADPITDLHAFDRDLVERMLDFALDFDDFDLDADLPVRELGGPEEFGMLVAPWAAYAYAFGEKGQTVRERFLKKHRRTLSTKEAGWLEAQGRAWFAPWEVIGVAPGASIDVRDLLTGEERHVTERTASQSVLLHDVVLGRIVDHAGLSVFCGMHPCSLRPREGHAFVEMVRTAIGAMGFDEITQDVLRQPHVGTMLIVAWEEVWGALRSAPMPALQNSDGEPLVLVRDELSITGALADVRAALLRLPGATSDEELDFDGETIQFLREAPSGSAGERTAMGRACLSPSTLVLETMSRERAKKLRKDVESACKGLVRFTSRSEKEGAELLADVGSPSGAAAGVAHALDEAFAPAEVTAMIRAVKTKHYAEWCGIAVPALGNLTPRAVADSGTKRERAQLELMMKEIARIESAGPADETFDVDILRKQLGLVAPPSAQASKPRQRR